MTADRCFPEISWHSHSEALEVKRLRLEMVESSSAVGWGLEWDYFGVHTHEDLQES